MLSVRDLTPEEVREFGYQEVNSVNWGVCLNGEPVAYFSAEPLDGDVLEVHATAKRRRLHPAILREYAQKFSDRLLALGATGLVAKIASTNRASLWLAKAAGFREQGVEGDFVVLVKYEQTETSTNNGK